MSESIESLKNTTHSKASKAIQVDTASSDEERIYEYEHYSSRALNDTNQTINKGTSEGDLNKIQIRVFSNLLKQEVLVADTDSMSSGRLNLPLKDKMTSKELIISPADIFQT